MRIIWPLTDNDSQVTDRLTSKKREVSGKHKLDVRCKTLHIEHRLCPPRLRSARSISCDVSRRLKNGRLVSPTCS